MKQNTVNGQGGSRISPFPLDQVYHNSQKTLRLPVILGVFLGDRTAYFLNQLRFLLSGSSDIHEDLPWVRKTYDDWASHIGMVSTPTVTRIIERLRGLGIIRSEQWEKSQYDRTYWYTINDRIFHLFEAIAQEVMDSGQMPEQGLERKRWLKKFWAWFGDIASFFLPNRSERSSQIDLSEIVQMINLKHSFSLKISLNTLKREREAKFIHNPKTDQEQNCGLDEIPPIPTTPRAFSQDSTPNSPPLEIIPDVDLSVPPTSSDALKNVDWSKFTWARALQVGGWLQQFADWVLNKCIPELQTPPASPRSAVEGWIQRKGLALAMDFLAPQFNPSPRIRGVTTTTPLPPPPPPPKGRPDFANTFAVLATLEGDPQPLSRETARMCLALLKKMWPFEDLRWRIRQFMDAIGCRSGLMLDEQHGPALAANA